MSGTDDLAGLLSDNGIRVGGGGRKGSALSSILAGRSEQIVCPVCRGGSKSEVSCTVKIDDDGLGATWHCWRGNCGAKGGVRVKTAEGYRRPAPAERAPPKAPPVHAQADQSKPAALYAFFEKRGISAETVDYFGCYITKRWFPGDLGEQPAIVFPYLFNKVVVNRKYRPPQKSPQVQEKDALPTLFNIDSVEADDLMIFCEGEPDVMAIFEAGYRQIVTLPNGAGDTLLAEDDPKRGHDRRYLPLATHEGRLATIKKIIIAGDMDGPGMVLREELARRLGRHRCWLVDWPDGCKDAGDCLRDHGPQAVRDAIESAEPYPIAGIQMLKSDTLLKLRSLPPPPVLRTDLTPLDRIIRWPGEGGCVVIITGIPGNGKSSFIRYVMMRQLHKYPERRWLVFSPEMQPWEQFAASCAEVFLGKTFYAQKDHPLASDEDLTYATDWMKKRVSFLASDAEEKAPTLDWILDRTKDQVLRFGVTDTLLDPWNEIEHDMQGLSETQYIGRCIQRCRSFGARYGVTFYIIAHPTKLTPAKPGEEIKAPGLYDISGGANWANKADIGITVHTPIKSPTQIIVQKSRFPRWGVRGSKVELLFDQPTGRYMPLMGGVDEELQ